MEHFIFKEGQQHGPYSPRQISKMIHSRHIRSTDFYWHEGMSDWQRISVFISSRLTRKARFAFGIILLVAVIFASGVFSEKQGDTSKPSNPFSAVLDASGLDAIPVSASRERMIQYLRYLDARDTYNRQRMIDEFDIIYVPLKTPVTILERGGETTRVAIRDGMFRGDTVYVASEWVK